jgi:glyoxylase-like metal-dependent hydrolase (beta-lactamase superfamily II)
MKPIQLFDPASSTYTYVLFDQASRDAVIIDPVDEQLERDLATLQEYGLKLAWTVETHAHADHITSAGRLAELAGARTAAPQGCGIGTAGVQLQHGDTLKFGAETLHALHTPGHTAGSMSFLWREHVFTGDTLLINGCGRTDFQSGSASDLYRSLTQVLFALPGDTTVWPGHDYQGRSHSSIGQEKAGNARVAGKSEAEFVALMDSLQLPRPRRIDEAVPANLSSGLRHDADGALQMRPIPAAGAHRRAGGLETVARHGHEPGVRSPDPGGRWRQEAGAAVPQRRALDRCGQTGRRAWAGGLQHPRRLRGRPGCPGPTGPKGWLALARTALAAELRPMSRRHCGVFASPLVG